MPRPKLTDPITDSPLTPLQVLNFMHNEMFTTISEHTELLDGGNMSFNKDELTRLINAFYEPLAQKYVELKEKYEELKFRMEGLE